MTPRERLGRWVVPALAGIFGGMAIASFDSYSWTGLLMGLAWYVAGAATMLAAVLAVAAVGGRDAPQSSRDDSR